MKVEVDFWFDVNWMLRKSYNVTGQKLNDSASHKLGIWNWWKTLKPETQIWKIGPGLHTLSLSRCHSEACPVRDYSATVVPRQEETSGAAIATSYYAMWHYNYLCPFRCVSVFVGRIFPVRLSTNDGHEDEDCGSAVADCWVHSSVAVAVNAGCFSAVTARVRTAELPGISSSISATVAVVSQTAFTAANAKKQSPSQPHGPTMRRWSPFQ